MARLCGVAVLLALVVTLGMLVVVPLGTRLIGGVPALTGRIWLAGAVPGAASLWLPRGALAAGLAAGYALATGVLAAHAPLRLLRRRRFSPGEFAVLTALAAPLVAGSALVAERYGYRLLGFDLEILALTVAHFLYAGFAAALVAALVCASSGDRLPARIAALCVPGGIAVVFVGFFTSDVVELAGAAILTAGMWLVALLTWYEMGRSGPDAVTRALLVTTAVVLPVTMLLALSWAAGQVVELPHPTLDGMVATHGLANALGFGLCSMLAWRRVQGGTGWTV